MMAAVGPSVAVMEAHGWSAQVPISFVLAAVAGGVVAWLLVLRLMNHAVFGEISKFLAFAHRGVRKTS